MHLARPNILLSTNNAYNEINPCHHEEADTRMLLHPAVHAAKHGHTKTVLRAVDTDIPVLRIAQI